METGAPVGVVIADQTPQLVANLVHDLAAEADLGVWGVATDEATLARELLRTQPDAAVVDVGLAGWGSTAVQELCKELPPVGLVVTGVHQEAIASASARWGHGSEAVLKPFGSGQISAAVRRVVATRRASDPLDRVAGVKRTAGCTVVSVLAGKGGVGSSTVACNLAARLAQERAVVLVNLGPPWGGVATLMRVGGRRSLAELLPDEPLDQWRAEAPVSSAGVSVVVSPWTCPAFPGPVTRAGEVVAPEQRVRLGLQRFRQEADVVILDLPPHFDDAVIAALDASDRILVVSDLGLIGGGHVRVVVRVLTTDLGISPEKVAVVASDRRGTGGVGRRDLEETLKLQVVASLPHDPAVLCAAARDGVPFVVGQRGSQVASAIEDVARYICPELAPVEAERPSGGGRWFGRLGRR